jgi:plasmid stabilization system protein ParE
MRYKAIFLSRALRELADAWAWYEERQPGLGNRFTNEVFKRISLIEHNPQAYPQRKRPYREAIVTVFPYLIIYRVHEAKKLVLITSIFHTRRNPARK